MPTQKNPSRSTGRCLPPPHHLRGRGGGMGAAVQVPQRVQDRVRGGAFHRRGAGARRLCGERGDVREARGGGVRASFLGKRAAAEACNRWRPGAWWGYKGTPRATLRERGPNKNYDATQGRDRVIGKPPVCRSTAVSAAGVSAGVRLRGSLPTSFRAAPKINPAWETNPMGKGLEGGNRSPTLGGREVAGRGLVSRFVQDSQEDCPRWRPPGASGHTGARRSLPLAVGARPVSGGGGGHGAAWGEGRGNEIFGMAQVCRRV